MPSGVIVTMLRRLFSGSTRRAMRARASSSVSAAVTSLRSILGVDSLLMGFGLDDDQMHSPNEKFEEVCFHHGIRSHIRLLAKFAGG